MVDIQADADALSIYKLVYMPLKTHSNSKNVDDFEIDEMTAQSYFNRLLDEALPEEVAGAIVPGDELKTIDFSKSVDADMNSVEQSANQILQTAGGGAVLNSNKITSSAAFEAWLKEETEFAISTLIGQINGFTNRFLSYHVTNPAKVEHFEVSIYTKDQQAKQLLESCQYSFANRLAYNTFNGISEKDSLAMMYIENEVLNLPELMKYPLSSSFTASGKDEVGEVGEGAPKKDATELSEEGDRSRNR